MKTLLATTIVLLLVTGCAVTVDEPTASTTAPECPAFTSRATQPGEYDYGCTLANTDTMGISAPACTTYQIWLDGGELYNCTAPNPPPCRGFDGSPDVYECSTAQLAAVAAAPAAPAAGAL